ncbi:MAG TPA: cytochrome C [Accumulibacter sp.]|nr:cytochrome C [Accumulibacter sp.]HMW18749.1 cytochrome C [Accumulibacter sp.]HMX22569.1 cytochrome C [Accumulibacter sp.]HMY06096.1 cytochrome C [Accumulibacter sp.]HNC18776.1 cytochrome C [Accumulibacter sp.]
MKLIAVAAIGLLAASLAGHAADPDLARSLAAGCTGCHGTEGRAVPGAGFDSLAGFDQARMLQKLADFKSGSRPATVMHQIVKGYSDEQLALIAAYFAAQR